MSVRERTRGHLQGFSLNNWKDNVAINSNGEVWGGWVLLIFPSWTHLNSVTWSISLLWWNKNVHKLFATLPIKKSLSPLSCGLWAWLVTCSGQWSISKSDVSSSFVNAHTLSLSQRLPDKEAEIVYWRMRSSRKENQDVSTDSQHQMSYNRSQAWMFQLQLNPHWLLPLWWARGRSAERPLGHPTELWEIMCCLKSLSFGAETGNYTNIQQSCQSLSLESNLSFMLCASATSGHVLAISSHPWNNNLSSSYFWWSLCPFQGSAQTPYYPWSLLQETQPTDLPTLSWKTGEFSWVRETQQLGNNHKQPPSSYRGENWVSEKWCLLPKVTPIGSW